MDRLQVFEERSCWIKRGLLNKLPYTFKGYFLVNDHKDVRVIKWFLGVPNLRRSTPFYIYLYAILTWHKSFNSVAFCCWGEVVVSSEPSKRERIRKTAKYLTMAVRVEREHSVFWNQCYVLIHFIANILSKSSVPVYCLFVFACFFFLLCQFFCIFLFSVYARFRVLKQGQKTNIPKINGRT